MEKIGKYLEAFGYSLLIFSIFFKNYLGYLKIKATGDTLGRVCFYHNVKPFGWYVSAKNGIVKVPPCFPWYLKGFLTDTLVSGVGILKQGSGASGDR